MRVALLMASMTEFLQRKALRRHAFCTRAAHLFEVLGVQLVSRGKVDAIVLLSHF